jgi:hypothetical protein
MVVDGCSEGISDEVRASSIEVVNRIATIGVAGGSPELIIPLFMSILKCYACMYTGFSDNVRLLQAMSQKVFVFVEGIAANEVYKADIAILVELYHMFHRAGLSLKQRINVKLNKKFVKMLVEVGIGVENEEIRGLAAFIIGLTLFVLIVPILRKVRHEENGEPFPMVPFLSVGTIAAYLM